MLYIMVYLEEPNDLFKITHISHSARQYSQNRIIFVSIQRWDWLQNQAPYIKFGITPCNKQMLNELEF